MKTITELLAKTKHISLADNSDTLDIAVWIPTLTRIGKIKTAELSTNDMVNVLLTNALDAHDMEKTGGITEEEPLKIVIYISGGTLQGVKSNKNGSYLLLDADTDGGPSSFILDCECYEGGIDTLTDSYSDEVDALYSEYETMMTEDN